mmetsp:Transcript_63971/g.103461  ORF Transcript_63971/g.103461 Transcript_63971/m.103461 type:complete len:103 (-) Transcript_63971:219-527(-)
MTGGGATITVGGAWITVVLLMMVVLLVDMAAGGGGAGLAGAGFLADGAVFPMRPPPFAACASSIGTTVSTRAAKIDKAAPPNLSGDDADGFTSAATSGDEGS